MPIVDRHAGTGSTPVQRKAPTPQPVQQPSQPTFSVGTPPWQDRAPATQFQVQPYPTTPVPLSGADIADFASRRSSASRALKEAMARREAGTQEADTLFEQVKGRLARQRDRSEVDTRASLADRGLAFMPRFMGKALRDIRDSHAEALTSQENERASRLAALDEMVRMARVGRDEEHASIDRDTARRQADLAQLIRGIGG